MNKQIEEMRSDLIEIFDEEYEKRRLITPQNTAEKLTAKGYRKHSEGEWVVSKTEQAWNNGEYAIERTCSVCRLRRNIETQEAWKFCPNCGAKMKGGVKE